MWAETVFALDILPWKGYNTDNMGILPKFTVKGRILKGEKRIYETD